MYRFSGDTTGDNTHYMVKRVVNLAHWGEPHIPLHSKYHPLTVVLDSDHYSSSACYNFQYQIHSIEQEWQSKWSNPGYVGMQSTPH